MTVTVQIPTPLRRFTGDTAEVTVEGDTVREAMSALVDSHPRLKRHLYTDDGELRSFVNVFVNDENIRYQQSGDTVVADGDVVSIIPSIAGGGVTEGTPGGSLS